MIAAEPFKPAHLGAPRTGYLVNKSDSESDCKAGRVISTESCSNDAVMFLWVTKQYIIELSLCLDTCQSGSTVYASNTSKYTTTS